MIPDRKITKEGWDELGLKVNSGLVSVIHITFEPGDMTRYDFFVYKHFDEFSIMPYESTFKMPGRLNRFNIIAGVEEYEDAVKNAILNKSVGSIIRPMITSIVNKILEDKSINPNTILQIARAIYFTYNLNNDQKEYQYD